MKRIYFLILVVLFIAVVLRTGASYGQTIPAGPRIVLEDEEITLMEDGKVSKKMYVSQHGEEEQIIFKELEQKVFKKLGVQSHNEVSDKKIVAKYNEEINKLVSLKKIEPPRLKFLDENGNVVKEISLVSEKWKGKIKETRRHYKKGEYDAEMVTVKWPKVSRQGKYAVMDNTTFADAGYSVSLGKIVLYDVAGNVLFEKQFPHGRAIYGDLRGHMVVSDSGTVAVYTSEGNEGPDKEILFVFDKTGKELRSYPRENEQGRPDGSMLKISANGRFLAVSVDFEQKRTVFIDLEKSASWKADKDYVVYEISDDGIVTADYSDEIKRKRSGTVIIDLTERVMP